MRRGRSGPRRGTVDVWVLLILGMAAGIVFLGMYAWNKRTEVLALEESGVEDAIKDLQRVHKWCGEIRRLVRSAPSTAGDPSQGLLTFFDQQAKEVGIEPKQIISKKPLTGSQARDGYEEMGWVLTLRQISREQLAKFLFRIEEQRSFIKSKILIMKLDEQHQVTEANVTLVYYVRKP